MMFNFRGGPRKPDRRLEDHARNVEEKLAKLGVNVQDSRIPVENGFGWTFRQGSATIEVYVGQQDAEGSGFLQVLSPIINLPYTNLLPLYRHLLELNLQMKNAALGLYLDVVFVFSERPLEGLDPVEIENIISVVAQYADHLDDDLVREFGGRLYGRI
ncbi:MAG: hypothetical protein D6737_19220 [Chloroflexi bacterium]|nr:MAG: hypothetical protein D6737_19220 [Chloroflexota bacterium]